MSARKTLTAVLLFELTNTDQTDRIKNVDWQRRHDDFGILALIALATLALVQLVRWITGL